jgi:HD-GYP domain-containing protein (c-di-GMP phosphodiesterase class II)
VAKRDRRACRTQKPGFDALGQFVAGQTDDALQQPGLHDEPADRGRVKHVPGRRGQPSRPGQNGVAHGRGDPIQTRPQNLGHEEGVSGGLPIQVPWVDRRPACEQRDRLRRERRQRHPAHRRLRRQIAQEDAQRMAPAYLVIAKGGDQQCSCASDAATQEPKQVERRLIGPVDVLEHRQRGCRGGRQVVEKRPIERDAGVAPGRQVSSHVQERTQGSRRRQRIAAPDENPSPLLGPLDKPAEEGGLADPRLATDEDQSPPPRGRLVEQTLQDIEVVGALQQLHRQMIPPVSVLWKADPEAGGQPARSLASRGSPLLSSRTLLPMAEPSPSLIGAIESPMDLGRDTAEATASRSPSQSSLRLAEILAALSLATDLANAFPTEKALRNCLLAVQLGQRLGISGQDLSDVYYFSLLRSIGCTSYAYEEALAVGDDQNFRNTFAGLDSANRTDVLRRAVTRLGEHAGPLGRARAVGGFLARAPRLIDGMAAANCEASSRLAERLGLSSGVRAALAEIHERWDGAGIPRHLAGQELTVAARIGVLCHDVTVHSATASRDELREMVRRRAGGEHDPAVANAFLSDSDGLLDTIEAGSVWDAALEAEPEPRPWLPPTRLDEVVRAFADFADLKSPYTLRHSSGVADLAESAIESLGATDADAVSIRRAGGLHDLGRVSVSNAIWDRRAALSSADWERVRLHPYYSERLLDRSPVLRPYARLAGAHHERLDGSGYHRASPAALLPRAARVLAAADAFHAMIEPRPHRAALEAPAAIRALQREVNEGRLDADAAEAVLAAAGQHAERARPPWPAELTDREVDVLRLVVIGQRNREIATRLFISEETIRTHIRHIYEKVGLSSRAGLALFAMEHDLIRS